MLSGVNSSQKKDYLFIYSSPVLSHGSETFYEVYYLNWNLIKEMFILTAGILHNCGIGSGIL